jgi:hypothetical protein
MSGKSRTAVAAGEAERRLAPLAARQHGVVSREQLRRAGLTEYAIGAAVERGRLHRVFRGVYAYGRPDIGEPGRLMAAVLACGPGTVVSHRSAAALMGLIDRGPAVIDVIAPGSGGRGIDGIRAHRAPPPGRSEVGTFAGIPCTSPARTLVDLAGVAGERTLRGAFERAAAKKLLDVAAVEAATAPGRRGIGTLRKLVGEWRRAAPVAKKGKLKSPLEAMVLPLLASRGIEMPRPNSPVTLADGSRIEVDFLWDERRLALEADSRDFHGTEVAFERDRWRDRELLRVGYSTLRVTKLQAEHEAEAIADAIVARFR